MLKFSGKHLHWLEWEGNKGLQKMREWERSRKGLNINKGWWRKWDHKTSWDMCGWCVNVRKGERRAKEENWISWKTIFHAYQYLMENSKCGN